MTKEEKDYCDICGLHESCAYVSRGLQNKCEKIEMFSDGFEAAIHKVIMWLHELTPEQLSNIDFDDFEKAMCK